MTVEVIGQDEGQKRNVTCKNCGAVLQFYKKDIESESLYSMCEYEGEFYYIVCPQCNARVGVKDV